MDASSLARLVSLNDQDLAECDRWVRESSNQEKIAVWLAIQKLGGPDNPVEEIVSRFAQLAFSQAMERFLANENKE